MVVGSDRDIDRRTDLVHGRIRHKWPLTNGVCERTLPSLKYEVLREGITDGVTLPDAAERFRQAFRTIRPHEVIDMWRLTDDYLPATPDLHASEPEPDSCRGTAGGKFSREIMRRLKCYVVREVYTTLRQDLVQVEATWHQVGSLRAARS